jgi:signal peptidase I
MTKQTDPKDINPFPEKDASVQTQEDQRQNDVAGQFSIFDQEISGTLFTQTPPEEPNIPEETTVIPLKETAAIDQPPIITKTVLQENPDDKMHETLPDTDASSVQEDSSDETSAPMQDEYYIPQFDIPPAEKKKPIEDIPPSSVSTADFTADNITDDKAENIAHRLVAYSEIKNKSELPEFETPYLYKGKKGEHIRYRLSLPTDKNPKKERMKRSIISLGITVITALILAFLLRSFVFVLATVDGPSMEPTLQNNEKILVTRYSYYFHEIERGDVIVCRFDNENYPDYYVKRVVALGGETVKIENGIVYVNDVPLEENYIKEPPRNDMEEVLVPAGYVFVMGDNRNNSTDSRKSYIGPIAQELVVGKARCILFPLSNFGSIEE